VFTKTISYCVKDLTGRSKRLSRLASERLLEVLLSGLSQSPRIIPETRAADYSVFARNFQDGAVDSFRD